MYIFVPNGNLASNPNRLPTWGVQSDADLGPKIMNFG